MQNVTILGITLQDRTLKEAMEASDRYLSNGALDVVAYVNHDVLEYAERSSEVREFLKDSGMTLWEDKRILHLAGINDSRRQEEVESRTYVKRLLDKLARNGDVIAVAASDESVLTRLKEDIISFEPGLPIVHETLIRQSEAGIPEDEINGINEHSPAVVIARLDYGLQREWLQRAGNMINAGIWLAMPPDMELRGRGAWSTLHKLGHRLSFRRFSKRAKKAMEGQNDI